MRRQKAVIEPFRVGSTPTLDKFAELVTCPVTLMEAIGPQLDIGRAVLHVRDVGGDLLRACCRMLDIAGYLLRGRPLLVYYSFDGTTYKPLPFFTSIRWGRIFTMPQ